MKKYLLLIGFLTLTIACNIGSPAPEAESTPTAALQPTLVPATTTPTFTPAPTNTPIPPRFFTDEFDTASTFWQFQQTGGSGSPQTIFENGSLRIDIPSPDTWYIGIHSVYSYPGVFIRAKASASSTGSIGLICRYDELTGWFEFNIDNNGVYNVLLGKWLAPGIAKYIPVASDGSSHLTAGNVNTELGLFCEGNFLSLYVNDTVIRRVDVTNYGLTEGNVGIAVASYREAPMSAIFEWVKVSGE
jgi:hypothetical protein